MGFVLPLRRLCRPCLLALAITASVAAVTSAQSTSTSLTRTGLDRYPLALCNDGSAAVYYHEREQVILSSYNIVETKILNIGLYIFMIPS